jgi:hypothetical protein
MIHPPRIGLSNYLLLQREGVKGNTVIREWHILRVTGGQALAILRDFSLSA